MTTVFRGTGSEENSRGADDTQATSRTQNWELASGLTPWMTPVRLDSCRPRTLSRPDGETGGEFAPQLEI